MDPQEHFVLLTKSIKYSTFLILNTIRIEFSLSTPNSKISNTTPLYQKKEKTVREGNFKLHLEKKNHLERQLPS
jgi:hypothetical protein